MNESELAGLLQRVAQGSTDVGDALEILKSGPLGLDRSEFATLDLNRRLRLGLGEVVYGEGKTARQILDIVQRLSGESGPILVTRIDEAKAGVLREAFPRARLNGVARTALIHAPDPKDSSSGEPFVALVSAGTSDQPVLEEARETCLAMDVAVEAMVDVGVAGLHRLVQHLPTLRKAAAVVVVAGMDGVLPSVVGGLVPGPIIGVPTSVGYGTGIGGIGALLTMLNSCSPGVVVTNIDAGFSGAVAACNVVRAVAGSGPSRTASHRGAEVAL